MRFFALRDRIFVGIDGFSFKADVGEAKLLFDLRVRINFYLLLLKNEFVVLAGLYFYADFYGLFDFYILLSTFLLLC
jgi:hypothetical protein